MGIHTLEVGAFNLGHNVCRTSSTREMIILLLSIFIISKTFCGYESFHFTGSKYLSEEKFSRELKSRYDLILKKWTFASDNTIDLDAYVFTDQQMTLDSSFENLSPNPQGIFSNIDVKYFNWGILAIFGLYGAIFWDWGKVHGFKLKTKVGFNKISMQVGQIKYLTQLLQDPFPASDYAYELGTH